MLWNLFVKILLVSSLIAWWLKRPASRFQKFFLYAATLATFWVVAPLYASLCLAWSVHYTREGIRYWSLDELLLRHASMLVTLAAVVWLLHRAWQTLWKPTTDLISILGVDVPEAPDVSLAGIRPDAATLNWTRPSLNRPVQKFLIQVNGVNVGESRQEETAITVTGLRPNHCYNIRVIAVGPNNFQAGSQVIRLRTYRSDGRPELGNSRLPDSFQDQEPRVGQSQCAEDNAGRSQVPTIEAAPSLEPGSAAARDVSTTTSGQRRNTVNRRHSPSIASQEQPSIKDLPTDQPEESLKDLADALEKTRREIDETTAQHTQEEGEFKQLEQRLKKERDDKKRVQKEKDDATAQLKQKVKASYEQMRQASKDKARKENQLREKQDKLKKVRDNIEKWTAEIENMRRTREGYAAEKESMEQDRDLKIKHLDEENSALQEEFCQLETEYMEKKKQLKELEDERKKLPGGEEDDTWKEDDRKMKREFEARRRELQSQLIMENRKAQQLDGHLHVLNAQLYASTQQGMNFFNQANSSGVDFDQNAPAQIKRRSRTGNSLSNAAVPSPTGPYPSDSPFGTPIGFGNRSTYGPFAEMQASEGLITEQFAEADLRALTAGAPLSPTATMLLPSGILGDDFDDEPHSPGSFSRKSPFAPDHDMEAESPASSGRSKSAQSSPPGSSHKPKFPVLAPNNGERASLNDMMNSPGTQPPQSGHRLGNLFSSFHRNRGVKSGEEGGPPLGSLKHGQSQSFPRQTDEFEPTSRRRTSFSSYTQNRNSAGPETLDGGGLLVPEGMLTSARRLLPFSGVFADRDLSSPRPASMASADLPRPSTDSGSIWNRPSENHRFWSDTSVWTSRNPSRRPSIHGSPAALKTTLASADDEILDYEELKHPSQVGVIGSRPPGNRQAQESKASLSQRLNPAAPTFIGGIFGWKDRESDSGKDKDKAKSKEKSKDKAKDKGLTRDVGTPSLDLPQGYDASPTDSRKSRDAFSVHTANSVSESRESLTLDRALSSTVSESNSFAKEEDNVVRRLFRKGSSSKFGAGLSTRLVMEAGGLFKKGPGSTTNSDKNMSAGRSSIGDIDDYGDDGLLGRSYESTTSSPAFGATKSKETKESRMTGWSNKFSMKKKGKDTKESLELQRAPESELEEEKKDV